MKIVIAGCGQVGGELAQQLAREGHAVTVIDMNARRVEAMGNQYDLMGVVGNCASLPVLREAETPSADLLIASTASDEQNLLTCLLARKLGVGNTIARVRDPDYVQNLEFLAEELGLSMYINPEYSAASEISRLLRFPAAQKAEIFAGGRAELVEIALPADSELLGLPLRDVPKAFGGRILICAVLRGEEALIPRGSFVLQEGDRVCVTGEPSELERLFHKWGLMRRKLRSVMLVGGGRISYYLARMLLEMGVRVKIVEKDAARCESLCQLLPEALIVEGDGSDQELLGEIGLDSTDAVVALTGSDQENLILGLNAASLGAGNTVVKVSNGNFMRLGAKAGIGSIISPKHITASMILRYVRGMSRSMDNNVEALHSICSGQVEALEFSVGKSGDMLGIPLKDLKLKKNLLLACIIRGARTIIPGGGDELRPGDHVLVVTTETGLADIGDILD